uniref:Uncharacterized protein n=1 Tax=Magallana gigas TaxID=29159 RepID=K1QFW3_MAGGI
METLLGIACTHKLCYGPEIRMSLALDSVPVKRKPNAVTETSGIDQSIRKIPNAVVYGKHKHEVNQRHP